MVADYPFSSRQYLFQITGRADSRLPKKNEFFGQNTFSNIEKPSRTSPFKFDLTAFGDIRSGSRLTKVPHFADDRGFYPHQRQIFSREKCYEKRFYSFGFILFQIEFVLALLAFEHCR